VVATADPAIFDVGSVTQGQHQIASPALYIKAVIALLHEKNYCVLQAKDGGGNPANFIDVKNSNDISEEFDIVTSTGFAVWKYNATYRNANF